MSIEKIKLNREMNFICDFLIFGIKKVIRNKSILNLFLLEFATKTHIVVR